MFLMALRTASALVLLCIAGLQCPATYGLQAVGLRCEYRVNPEGIDVAQPRLSWLLQAYERGQKQTAYHVIVSSSPEELSESQGDLWDSGRVTTDQSIHVEYAGKKLLSRSRCYWKVKVWDSNGRPSDWSESSSWTMGLLQSDDWKAKWISDAQASRRKVESPYNGYHSRFAETSQAIKWISINLKNECLIDSIQLWPARPYQPPDTDYYLYPLRFKVEVSSTEDFADSHTVVDCTDKDVPRSGLGGSRYHFEPVNCRYVRLTVTRLRAAASGEHGLALAEIQVFSGDRNVAVGAEVECSDSIEDKKQGWSKDYVVMWPTPCSMLRKVFVSEGQIKRAVAYVTSRGAYEFRINGRRVGNHILAPEWTNYHKRIQYQTYEITDFLTQGTNCIGAILGEGFYSGRVGYSPPGRCFYGGYPQFLAQLEIELGNGQRQIVATDATWSSTDKGPIRSSDILDGEYIDARKKLPDWDLPSYNDESSWISVSVAPLDRTPLVWQPNQPVRVATELRPIKLTEPKSGVYVFDLGQNMVGWCQFKTHGPAGTCIRLRHAERLDANGMLYTDCLRTARQTDHFVLCGEGEEVFEPHFTYHGFRYVEVTGLSHPPMLDDLLGRVFHSSSPRVSEFTSSNTLVNQLMKNIVWTQRGNMHSLFTDCPQRDERLGWTGDAQVFCQTAMFNMDMSAFFTKWLKDMRDEQLPDGRFPNFAPRPFFQNFSHYHGNPGWSDAGTIIPWRMYQNYADKRLLRQHYDSSRRWVDFVRKANPDLIWRRERGRDPSDWLNGDRVKYGSYPSKGGAVPREVFATAMFAHSTQIVAKMANALEREGDAEIYSRLHKSIKAAFNKEFVKPDGSIIGDTQAGYALALRFDLVPESMRPKVTDHLLEAINRYEGLLSTGIQSTNRMMLELTNNGHHNVACQLINNKTIPSWGYPIEMGATTIWERWDGFVEGRGFQDPSMNSFNHCAFGAVSEWVWRNIVGINPDDNHPGYKHFRIRPLPGQSFTWAKGHYDSIRGRIVSDWRIEDNQFILRVRVPVGSTATVFVPSIDPASITENGNLASQSDGLAHVRNEPSLAVYDAVSGEYLFKSKVGQLFE